MNRRTGDLAQSLANEGERKLPRQELVIGDPAARRRLRIYIGFVPRFVQALEAFFGALEALLAQKCLIQPLRQVRDARHCRLDRLAKGPRGQACRQPVDRLDERHVLRFGRTDHVVGVDHGSPPVEPVHLAADDHRLIDGQGLLEPVPPDAEEGERQFAGLVVEKDAIGHVRSATGCRLVPVYPARDGNDRTVWSMGNAGLAATIDQRMRDMEQEIDDAAVFNRLAPEQARVKFAGLRADAGQCVEGRKQRIEQGRAHSNEIATIIPALARLTTCFPAFIEPMISIRRAAESRKDIP